MEKLEAVLAAEENARTIVDEARARARTVVEDAVAEAGRIRHRADVDIDRTVAGMEEAAARASHEARDGTRSRFDSLIESESRRSSSRASSVTAHIVSVLME